MIRRKTVYVVSVVFVVVLGVGASIYFSKSFDASFFGSTVEDKTEWVAMHPKEYRDAIINAKKEKIDLVLALYRDPLSRDSVIGFFEAITQSRQIAEVILKYADEFEVSPSLVFALAWEESRYNPRAVNKNKASIDRGLFQLNSKSFTSLKEEDFFNPDINSRYGVAHLRWCLDLAGSEVAGLAMYNAGTTRVRSDSTPKSTLDYISRIQNFQAGIDQLFQQELASRWIIADGGVRPASPKAGESRLASVRFPLLNAFRQP
ncbi:MAG: transglycosylase SLT domain-containing protein [Treponema sp.]|nr:transglycosylase SLT domain-containing protein [Treponema sp.]